MKMLDPRTGTFTFMDGGLEIYIQKVDDEFFKFSLKIPLDMVKFSIARPTPEKGKQGNINITKRSNMGGGIHRILHYHSTIINNERTNNIEPTKNEDKPFIIHYGYDLLYGYVGLAENSLDALVKARSVIKIEEGIFFKYGFIWKNIRDQVRKELVTLYNRLSHNEKTLFAINEGNPRAMIMFIISLMKIISVSDVGKLIDDNFNLVKQGKFVEFFEKIYIGFYEKHQQISQQENNNKVFKEQNQNITSGGVNGNIRINQNTEVQQPNNNDIRETSGEELQPHNNGHRGYTKLPHRPDH